jgi:hypothetical protein
LDEIGMFENNIQDRNYLIKRLEELTSKGYKDYAYALKSWAIDKDDYQTDLSKYDLFEEACEIAGLEFISLDCMEIENDKVKITLETSNGTFINTVSKKYTFQLSAVLMEEVMNTSLLKNGESFFIPIIAEGDFIHYAFLPISVYIAAIEKGVLPLNKAYLAQVKENFNI